MRSLRTLAVIALLLVFTGVARANQVTWVTPAAPLPMTSLATFLNNAHQAIGTCNSGTSSPTVGPAGAPIAGMCWYNTTTNAVEYYNGSAWVGPTFPSVTLGVSGTTLGTLVFNNLTSGSITVEAPTGALGTAVLTLPDATDTLTANAAAQTLTTKTFDTASNTFKIGGTQVSTLSSTLSISAGALGCTTATTSQIGCIKPDGTTITISAGVITAVLGGGTVNSGTAGQLGYYATSSAAISGNPNATISAGVVTLGVAGSVVGGLTLVNVTSGSIKISPPTGALGTQTLTLPDVTDTLTANAASQTLTNKTFDTASNTFEINGTQLTSWGSTLNITAGVLGCTTATPTQIGCVKPDGSTITASGGTITTANLTIGATVMTPGNTYSTINGALTFGGNLTFAGLGAGTQVSCLGLTNANLVVPLTGACGGAGGGQGTVIICNGSNVGSTINSDLASNATVYLSGGTCVSSVAITIPVNSCLIGAGPNVTILQIGTGASALDGIDFTTGFTSGGCARGMTIRAGTSSTTANVSSGNGVYLNENGLVDLSDLIITGFTTGFQCHGGFQNSIKNVEVQYYTIGFYLNTGACGLFVNAQAIGNSGAIVANSVGWDINDDGGSIITTSGSWSNDLTAVLIRGGANGVQISNFVANAGNHDCFQIRNSFNVMISNTNAASCPGWGLYVGHNNEEVSGFMWSGGSLYGNGGGAFFNANNAVLAGISGALIVDNGYNQVGVNAVGISLNAVGGSGGAGSVTLTGNIIGNTAGITQQLYGINYGSSVNVTIADNDLTNNSTASAAGSLSGTSYVNDHNRCKGGTTGAC